jgi:hypothetical protein
MSTTTKNVEPCCGKCGSKEWKAQQTAVWGTGGKMIYCGGCGAVVTFLRDEKP